MNWNIVKWLEHQRIRSQNCLIDNEYVLLLVNNENIKTLLYFNIGNIVYNNDDTNEKKKMILICVIIKNVVF